MKLMIDAGHGLPDPGAVGPSGLQEAQVTLSVARLLGSRMDKAGWQVRMTRDGPNAPTHPRFDQSADLYLRVEKANDWLADVFVSIHCNSAVNPDANGIETYVAHVCSVRSQQLAQLVQSKLVSATKLQDRGVRRANYYVLRRTKMPAILVELAFISNPKEEALLADLTFHRICAEAIASALAEYEKTVLKKKE